MPVFYQLYKRMMDTLDEEIEKTSASYVPYRVYLHAMKPKPSKNSENYLNLTMFSARLRMHIATLEKSGDMAMFYDDDGNDYVGFQMPAQFASNSAEWMYICHECGRVLSDDRCYCNEVVDTTA